jgi:putative transposase
MPEYRRTYLPGATYFFTVKTLDRRPILTRENGRAALRRAITDIQAKHPFVNIAWVLLPDHLHAIWRLPEKDSNFSLRWSLIKQQVSRQCAVDAGLVSANASQQKRHERAFWQRRFWEHVIRDENDFERHVDYIHYNPVKHGYVQRTVDWPYSTFHQYVRRGVYPADWATADEDGPINFGE